MDFSLTELGLELPDGAHALRTGIRLLVALGAALFTIIPLEDGAGGPGLAEIGKGISAGIGFLGAGTILKLTDQQEVKGLTTAAGIWLTAAAGFAAGAGWIWPAVTAIALGLIALIFFRRIEIWMGSK